MFGRIAKRSGVEKRPRALLPSFFMVHAGSIILVLCYFGILAYE